MSQTRNKVEWFLSLVEEMETVYNSNANSETIYSLVLELAKELRDGGMGVDYCQIYDASYDAEARACFKAHSEKASQYRLAFEK